MHLKKLFACALVALGATVSALALTAANPFAGSWSGPYVGANGSGTVDLQISDTGVMTGILVNQDNVSFVLHGHLGSQGQVSAVALAPPDIIVPFGGSLELAGGNIVGTTFVRGTDIVFEVDFAPVLMPALSVSAAR